MASIKLLPEGKRIVLSVRREIGDIRKVRYLSCKEAVGIGFLLTADAPDRAINFEATRDISLQIINAPYETVFLSIRDPHGGRTLVICIEYDTIQKIGQRLLRLGQTAIGTATKNSVPYLFPISHCYLEDPEIE